MNEKSLIQAGETAVAFAATKAAVETWDAGADARKAHVRSISQRFGVALPFAYLMAHPILGVITVAGLAYVCWSILMIFVHGLAYVGLAATGHHMAPPNGRQIVEQKLNYDSVQVFDRGRFETDDIGFSATVSNPTPFTLTDVQFECALTYNSGSNDTVDFRVPDIQPNSTQSISASDSASSPAASISGYSCHLRQYMVGDKWWKPID